MTATIAKEKPIIFTGHSVPAILRGQKTQTRRVIKPQPHECHNGDLMYKDRLVGSSVPERSWEHLAYEEAWEVCPYGKPGDRLWVREAYSSQGWYSESLRTAFESDPDEIMTGSVCYKADGEQWWENRVKRKLLARDVKGHLGWYSPLFMPRWASRFTLEITEVRVERLQAITHEDAVAEGFGDHLHKKTPDAPYGRTWGRLGFSQQWDKLNAKRGFTWESDPFVWVIAFRRLEAS